MQRILEGWRDESGSGGRSKERCFLIKIKGMLATIGQLVEVVTYFIMKEKTINIG